MGRLSVRKGVVKISVSDLFGWGFFLVELIAVMR